MSKKLIVARPGYNAHTETNPNNFIFHSDYNTFKILKEDSATPTLADNGSTETAYNFAHGIGHTPFVFAFCKFENSRVGNPGCKASNVDFWFTRVVVNSTNVVFYYVNNTGGNYTPTFKYIACEVPTE